MKKKSQDDDEKETTRVICPECEGTGMSPTESDGTTYSSHLCDLCGGDGAISHAHLGAWNEARARRGF